jgi:hypothetical protein
LQKYYKPPSHINNPSIQYKQFVFECFLKAALNVALSFLRIVALGGKLLKTAVPAENVLFEEREVSHLVCGDGA